tara:strand:- start:262 stop:552 length:291 start_codon:yes stop_codon:yes gene_type:complete
VKISHNKFNNWLDTFVSEKGLDLEYNFEITSTKNKVYHIVELKIIIDYMKNLSVDNKYVCYDRIVKADFKNQNCLMFFGIVAQYIADQYDNVMEGA